MMRIDIPSVERMSVPDRRQYNRFPSNLVRALLKTRGCTPSYLDLGFALIDANVEPLRTLPGIAGAFNAFDSFVHQATPADIAAFELQMVACDVLVSNLGVIPFETSFGSLTLEGLWGPSVLMGTEGEQAIGVATLHGAIHLLHTRFAPLPSLLETAERILLAALASDK